MTVVVTEFCWDDWEQRHPVDLVETEPELHYGKFSTRREAEIFSVTGNDQMPFMVHVVRYMDHYYVVDMPESSYLSF